MATPITTPGRRIAAGLPSNPRMGQKIHLPSRPAPQPQRKQSAAGLPSRVESSAKPRPSPDNARLIPHKKSEPALPRYPRGSNPIRSSASSSSDSSSSSEDYDSSQSSATFSDVHEAKPNNSTFSNRSHSAIASLDHLSVWKTVAQVANIVTQEANRVWSSRVNPLETNDDDESSHLNSVLRAYHLSKARSPRDLPDWLFNEKERAVNNYATDSHPGNPHNRQVICDEDAEVSAFDRKRDRDAVMREPSNPPKTVSATDRLRLKRNLTRKVSKV